MGPRYQFINVPQTVPLSSQVESQCSTMIKTVSEVPGNRNINHQLTMKGHPTLSLLSNVWYWTLNFQLKIRVWRFLCVIIPANVLCSLVTWASVTNIELPSWYCVDVERAIIGHALLCHKHASGKFCFQHKNNYCCHITNCVQIVLLWTHCWSLFNGKSFTLNLSTLPAWHWHLLAMPDLLHF